MARKTPKCAYCGESLVGVDSLRWMTPHLPGNPEVGWHTGDSGKCAEIDPIRQVFPGPNPASNLKKLRTIEARGPGRLVANKGWLLVARDEK